LVLPQLPHVQPDMDVSLGAELRTA
jgi:hypothetical protein